MNRTRSRCGLSCKATIRCRHGAAGHSRERMDDDPVDGEDVATAAVIPLPAVRSPGTGSAGWGPSPNARLIPDTAGGRDGDPILGPEGGAPATDQVMAVPPPPRPQIVLGADHRVGVAGGG